MKNILALISILTLAPLAYSAQSRVPVEATCSYICHYTVEHCYDGCWFTTDTKKLYASFSDTTLEELDKAKQSSEYQKECVKAQRPLEFAEYKIEFTKISNFDCHVFKK